MAVTNRLRSVPPSMATDEELIELDPEIRLTGLLLRFYVDDHGRGPANLLLIKSQLYPLTPEIGEEQIEWHLAVLEDLGYIRTYKDDRNKLLLQVTEWPSQDRAQPSRLAAPPPDDPPTSPDAARGPREALASGSRAAREPLATPSRAAREDLAVVEKREESREQRASGESGASEAERARASLVGTPEPSPFCQKHPTGTNQKCMPCGRARLAHGQWVKAQMEAAAAEEQGD